MYPNPLNPRFRALHHRGGHSREIFQLLSSQPATPRNLERTTTERLLRHRRRTQEWAEFIGEERAKAVTALHAQGLRIYRSPDNERVERLVVHTSRECAGEDPDMYRRRGRLELEISGSLSERMERLMFAFDASIMAGSIYALSKTVLFRIDVEKTLRECERVLAPLASPTWIDSHTEGDVVDKPVDGKENSSDENIDSETKGKMDDMPRDTAENAMDEADEAERCKKEQKRKNKKRRRRVK
ncbi:hypothetical protein F4680DRAFT_468899 [Xylaria scruposa]|nr:hypothetical protein F4680DRAFT_468899 [Xylaria scruposa]